MIKVKYASSVGVCSLRGVVGILLTAVLMSTFCLAQQKGATLHTSGDCSPAVYGSHNVIQCGSLSKADAAILASILNEARASNRSLAEIRELIEKALDPNRTITGYLPDGEAMRTNNAAGVTVTEDKGEFDVFQHFISLERDKKWKELLEAISAEKAKVPAWFTCDAMEALAYIGLCDLDRALQASDKFIAETADIGNYSNMLEIVKMNRAKIIRAKESGKKDCVVQMPS